ncbi:MAG TPA: hypothetical protein PKY87_08220 [Terricaulis sp.]|nr:hypothetical protein [Terricaulis sp.]
MRALIFAASAAALCACAPAAEEKPETPAPPAQTQAENLAALPAWEDLREAGVIYRALGQEPGWMLDIHTSRRALLVLDYGERALRFELPYQYIRPSEGAYEANADGEAIAITISNGPCEDVMSGQPFPERVEVRVGARSYSGCGSLIYNDDPNAQRQGR